jgi:hypothetical protein
MVCRVRSAAAMRNRAKSTVRIMRYAALVFLNGGFRLDVACTRYATFLPRCSPIPISDKFSKKWGFRLSHTHKPRKMANLGRPYRMFSQPGGGHPNGGGGGSAGAIRSPPRPNHEAATTRPSPRLTLEGCNGRRPRVELRREYGAAVRSNGARRCPGPPWRTPQRQETLACEVATAVSKPRDGDGLRPSGKFPIRAD